MTSFDGWSGGAIQKLQVAIQRTIQNLKLKSKKGAKFGAL
jgi:hypothetical protein